MKILHLLSSNQFSGAENVACQIISMFKGKADYDMVYCSPDGKIRTALDQRSIPFQPLKKMNCHNLRSIIKQYKPDLIHAHDVRASILAAKFSRSCRIISHIHNNHMGMRKISLKSLLYFITLPKYKHIFWVSQSAYDSFYFKNAAKDKSSILYNTINIQELQTRVATDQNDYTFDIVHIGRLTHQKNPQRLIEVLRLCIGKMPNLQCAVIGDGELRQEVEALILQHGLENNIHLLGYRNNPAKILQSAKVMLLVSRYEGTPMCALEAMALGVPIVSTPTDGMCELVDDGETGFLSNNDSLLAEHVVNIVNDIDLYRTLSTHTKKRGNELLNTKTYSEKIQKIYTQGVMS